MVKTIKPTNKYFPPSEGFWRLTGVRHGGKTHVYDVMEKMTESMIQEKLAEFYENEKQKGNPYPMSSDLHFSIMEAAKKSEDKGLMNHFKEGLEKYPNTLSRVIYSPEEDEVIHNYKTSDAYSLTGQIIGYDNWIKNLKDKATLKLFLGTKDIKRINRVSDAINQTPMYFWRLNSKPFVKEERVVRFYASSSRLGLFAGGDPLGEYPAFRVLQVK